MADRIIVLNEHTNFGDETGAGLMRNRCAFTSKDMGATWDAAFTYAIVLGWDGEDGDDDQYAAMEDQAALWGWDDELVAFLRDAHQRFTALADSLGGNRG